MIRKLLRPLKQNRQTAPMAASCADEARTHGRMAVRDRYADIKTRLATESPTIVDGGANKGTTTALFLEQYGYPAIHAFEPIPELAEHLRKRFAGRPNVTIHEAAMGAEARMIRFNIVNNLVSSSVLNPSAINRSIHGQKMDVSHVAEVPQVRLEDVLGSDCPVDLLKLDLQGYELEALKGCGSLLRTIKIITTEVEFISLYDDQPLFAEIDMFLRKQGFKLLKLYELFTHPDGQLTSGDAVYLNGHFF